MSMHTRTHSPWVDMYYRRPKQLRPLVQKFLGQCDDVVGKGVASTGEVCLDGRESNSIFDAVRKNLQQRDRELLKTRDRVRSWLTALPHQGFERVRSDGSRSGNDAHEDTAAQDWPAECSMASTSPGAVPLMNMSEISSPDHNLLAPNDSASNYCLSPPLSRKEDPITISTPANQPGSRERALYAINDPSLATISQPPQIAVHSQVQNLIKGFEDRKIETPAKVERVENVDKMEGTPRRPTPHDQLQEHTPRINDILKKLRSQIEKFEPDHTAYCQNLEHADQMQRNSPHLTELVMDVPLAEKYLENAARCEKIARLVRGMVDNEDLNNMAELVHQGERVRQEARKSSQNASDKIQRSLGEKGVTAEGLMDNDRLQLGVAVQTPHSSPILTCLASSHDVQEFNNGRFNFEIKIDPNKEMSCNDPSVAFAPVIDLQITGGNKITSTSQGSTPSQCQSPGYSIMEWPLSSRGSPGPSMLLGNYYDLTLHLDVDPSHISPIPDLQVNKNGANPTVSPPSLNSLPYSPDIIPQFDTLQPAASDTVLPLTSPRTNMLFINLDVCNSIMNSPGKYRSCMSPYDAPRTGPMSHFKRFEHESQIESHNPPAEPLTATAGAGEKEMLSEASEAAQLALRRITSADALKRTATQIAAAIRMSLEASAAPNSDKLPNTPRDDLPIHIARRPVTPSIIRAAALSPKPRTGTVVLSATAQRPDIHQPNPHERQTWAAINATPRSVQRGPLRSVQGSNHLTFLDPLHEQSNSAISANATHSNTPESELCSHSSSQPSANHLTGRFNQSAHSPLHMAAANTGSNPVGNGQVNRTPSPHRIRAMRAAIPRHVDKDQSSLGSKRALTHSSMQYQQPQLQNQQPTISSYNSSSENKPGDARHSNLTRSLTSALPQAATYSTGPSSQRVQAPLTYVKNTGNGSASNVVYVQTGVHNRSATPSSSQYQLAPPPQIPAPSLSRPSYEHLPPSPHRCQRDPSPHHDRIPSSPAFVSHPSFQYSTLQSRTHANSQTSMYTNCYPARAPSPFHSPPYVSQDGTGGSGMQQHGGMKQGTGLQQPSAQPSIFMSHQQNVAVRGRQPENMLFM